MTAPLAIPNDEQLLASWAKGDREALEELFRRYRSVAYRVAYRLLGNEADALDAVQEGFVKALVMTASPGPMPIAIRMARSVSVPEEMPMA